MKGSFETRRSASTSVLLCEEPSPSREGHGPGTDGCYSHPSSVGAESLPVSAGDS